MHDLGDNMLMKPAAVIRGIDRQWDDYPNAANWLGIIWVIALLPLALVGWRPITVAIALFSCASSAILFGWRWTVHIRKVGSSWRKRRKKR